MKQLHEILKRKGYLLWVLLLAVCIESQAQSNNIAVTGVIISHEDNLPVPGVSVMIKGTSTGTITDFNGKYSIKANEGDILVFSFIGLQTSEKKVKDKTLNVSLAPETIDLGEVVAIGYGSVKKKELTGSVAHVKGEDIQKIVTSDLGTALQGQIAGVNVTASSGAPGASSNIQIRGISSVTGSNLPLYVVDGIPQDGDPRLSNNEIETIDILKDAASCAIYGTRGSAGVILITTKQGESGQIKIKADASYGIQKITSGTPLMNAQEQTYFDILFERNVNGNNDDEGNILINRNKYNYVNDNSLSPLVHNDNAAVQNYNINITGGSKDLSYNVVFGYYNQDGIVTNSAFERYNARANTMYKKGKWRVKAGVGFTVEENDKAAGNILTQNIRMMPYQYLPSDGGDVFETDGVAGGPQATALNSALRALQTEDNNTRDKLFGNVSATYQASKELSFTTNFGANVRNDRRHRFSPQFKIVNNDGTQINNPLDSYVEMTSSRNTAVSWDGSVNYTKKIKDHKFTATGAMSLEAYTFESFYGGKRGVVDNDIKVIDGAILNPYIYSNGRDKADKLVGTIARAQYDYKSRYLISASVRYDGSSRFAEEYRWGMFPSVSAAWNISDEAFWQPLADVANNFKFRASYGTTGNQNFASYSFYNNITQGIFYPFGEYGMELLANGAAQTQYANELVKWETSIQANVGIDLGLFKNRLTFSADYYDTRKNDMLFPVQLPSSAGVGTGAESRVTLNVGDMVNQGFEFAAGWRTQTGKVNWGVSTTFTKNTNVITNMTGSGPIYSTDSGLISGDTNSKITVLAEGYEAGAFFLHKTDGVIRTEDELQQYRQLVPSAQMGDLRYVDTNGDGEITADDREYMGSGLPDFEIGFNTNLEYKGFDFMMQWYASVGNDVMNGSKAAAYSYGRHADQVHTWSAANPNAPLPVYRGDSKAHDNYRGYTDMWLEDGSFLRLRAITLGYTFPKPLAEKMGMGKFRAYVTAQNPLTFTNYTGFDPEVGGNGLTSRGLDKGNYPVAAQYIMGIVLDF
ncbi:SusC/RagA family TonB-linked outer membrane protein [Saccharicrinis aurantiacus]|uniref:SusC/RagA family TonB-linked outer membrane protein n=1 Tax=Saccharicrinis aurantiacus TaxID=1849719 RepID=UPI00249142C8|nr:TonB-dependent receptor [Saccharicrinis aurantiacus]